MRRGELADIEAVYRLNRENFSEYWSKESLFSALEAGYDLLLCETDDQAVAYLLSLSVCDEIQVMQIAVAPDYRHQGLARRMTESLIISFPAFMVTLEVRAANHAARKLYAGLGFEEVGYRKNYYAADISGLRDDAVLMRFIAPPTG